MGMRMPREASSLASPGARLQAVVGTESLNSGSLEEQWVLLTVQSSLQPL